MWLSDHQGRFYSAVQHRDDPGLLVVRTRARADADALIVWAEEDGEVCPKVPLQVIAYEFSDYPWRVIMDRETWARFAAYVAEQVTYGNYKSHVLEVADHAFLRHEVLHDVWSVFRGLEAIDRPPPRWEEDWEPDADPWMSDNGQSLTQWLARGTMSPAEALAAWRDPFYAGEPARDDDAEGALAAAETDPWGQA